LKTGRFVDAKQKPMSNLFVEMLNRFGVEATSFGDSNGGLSEIG